MEKWEAWSFCLSLQRPSTCCYSVCCLCDKRSHLMKKRWGRWERNKSQSSYTAHKAFMIWPCLLAQFHLPPLPCASSIPAICHPLDLSIHPLSHLSASVSPLPVVLASPFSMVNSQHCSHSMWLWTLSFNPFNEMSLTAHYVHSFPRASITNDHYLGGLK